MMEQRVQLKTRKCGIDWLGSKIGQELQWIDGDPSDQQFVVGQVANHGLPFICNGNLGQLESLFGMDEIRIIEIASYDGLQIRKLVPSLHRGVAYMRLEGY